MNIGDRKERSREIEEQIVQPVANKVYQDNNLNFKRYTDKDYQYKGVDIEIDGVLYDEKTNVEYAYDEYEKYGKVCPLRNVFIELATKNRAGKYELGWYMKKNHLTEGYIFNLITEIKNNQPIHGVMLFISVKELEKLIDYEIFDLRRYCYRLEQLVKEQEKTPQIEENKPLRLKYEGGYYISNKIYQEKFKKKNNLYMLVPSAPYKFQMCLNKDVPEEPYSLQVSLELLKTKCHKIIEY